MFVFLELEYCKEISVMEDKDALVSIFKQIFDFIFAFKLIALEVIMTKSWNEIQANKTPPPPLGNG